MNGDIPSISGPSWHTYIVRVLLDENGDLTGQVNDPREDKTAPFRTLTELWRILSAWGDPPFPPKDNG